jgi:hypothetical protein
MRTPRTPSSLARRLRAAFSVSGEYSSPSRIIGAAAQQLGLEPVSALYVYRTEPRPPPRIDLEGDVDCARRVIGGDIARGHLGEGVAALFPE